jgi:hypothetical protein
MNIVGQIKRRTQVRIVALLHNLGYDYFSDRINLDSCNIEKKLLRVRRETVHGRPT